MRRLQSGAHITSVCLEAAVLAEQVQLRSERVRTALLQIESGPCVASLQRNTTRWCMSSVCTLCGVAWFRSRQSEEDDSPRGAESNTHLPSGRIRLKIYFFLYALIAL